MLPVSKTVCTFAQDEEVARLMRIIVAFRKRIEETAKLHGAEYRGDLSREITHLIARSPSGAKYKHAKLWGIKVVAIEWFEQSLERGMILDEALYDPLLEDSERGKGAWVRRSVSAASITKRKREDDVFALPGRKLRRSASSKLDSQSDGFWSDIITAAPQPRSVPTSKWGDEEKAEQASREPDSVASENKPALVQQKQHTTQLVSRPKGIFHGKRFFLHGFDLRQVKAFPTHSWVPVTDRARLPCFKDAFHPMMLNLFRSTLRILSNLRLLTILSFLSLIMPRPRNCKPRKIRQFRTF